jgi:GGDEF domain-containing protein
MAKNEKSFFDMERLYNDPSTFRARALEEIRRARRYATFVSLVSLDLSHIDAVKDMENYDNFDEFISSFRKLIKNSIRDTDLLSISNRRRILILLVDTPKEGASALAKRLKKTLKYFMANNTRSPLNWRIPMHEYCFPAPNGSNMSILGFLDKIAAG